MANDTMKDEFETLVAEMTNTELKKYLRALGLNEEGITAIYSNQETLEIAKRTVASYIMYANLTDKYAPTMKIMREFVEKEQPTKSDGQKH